MTPQRAWGPRAPSGPWDVLVIGAGVGGLSAALALANLGRRVLVLEQHTVPGGFSQSFRRAGWSWDVGVHLVGELGARGLAGRLFDTFSGNRLKWTRVEGAHDVAQLPSGRTIEYHASLGDQRAHLIEQFPHQAAALTRWFRLLHDGAGAMRDHFVARGLAPKPPSSSRELALTPTAAVLASAFEDPELKFALGLHWLFYGTPPSRSAFGVHALLARHYRHGAYYPVGGSMSLARTFSTELERLGGWVCTQASVEQLLVKHGRVSGVKLDSGEELHASAVISAAGALNTLKLLPPEERQHEWVAPIEALEPASAHVCLHLGFKGDIRGAGATSTNRFLVSELREANWDTRAARPPVMYVAFPSLKDGIEHDGLHTAELVALADWEPFAAHAGTRWRQRGPAYDALKERLSAAMLGVLFEHLPKLKPLVAYRELSTPLSTSHFTRAVNGSAYGLESSAERYACRWLRARSPVRGLHLAGCDVAMFGIAGALIGGLAAALSLEPEATGAWLRRTMRPKGGHRC